MKHSWHISSFSPPFIKEFFRRAKRRMVYGWGKDRFDYVTPPVIARVRKEIKIILKRKFLNRFYFHRNNLSDERYVFFPLQLQPEESTDIWGMWHSNQIATVENISKSLPLNYKLYVKEHKVAVGKRQGLTSYYDKLKHIPNVVLIHPFEDSHKVIKSADLVIVTSGTVGWEALLYGKPVITLGNVFFNDSGLVHRLNNFCDLKKTILHLLKNYQLDAAKLEKYMVALRNGTYDAYFNVSHQDTTVMNKDNIEKLAGAIYDETIHHINNA